MGEHSRNGETRGEADAATQVKCRLDYSGSNGGGQKWIGMF